MTSSSDSQNPKMAEAGMALWVHVSQSLLSRDTLSRVPRPTSSQMLKISSEEILWPVGSLCQCSVTHKALLVLRGTLLCSNLHPLPLPLPPEQKNAPSFCPPANSHLPLSDCRGYPAEQQLTFLLPTPKPSSLYHGSKQHCM